MQAPIITSADPSARDDRFINISLRLFSQTVGNKTYALFIGTPKYTPDENNTKYHLEQHKTLNSQWKKLLLCIHGSMLFPVQDARLLYVCRVPFRDVSHFFGKDGQLKRCCYLKEQVTPLHSLQVVDCILNQKATPENDRSLSFFIEIPGIPEYIAANIGERYDLRSDEKFQRLVRVEPKPSGSNTIRNSVWTYLDSYSHVRERAHLAIQTNPSGVVPSKSLDISSVNKFIQAALCRSDPLFTPNSSSTSDWLRMAYANVVGSDASSNFKTFSLESVGISSADVSLMSDDMRAPYVRHLGYDWYKKATRKASSMFDAKVSSSGVFKGKQCVFMAKRCLNKAPEYRAQNKTSESYAYHIQDEKDTTCWQHPLLFDVCQSADPMCDADKRDIYSLTFEAKKAVNELSSWCIAYYLTGRVELLRTALDMNECIRTDDKDQKKRVLSRTKSYVIKQVDSDMGIPDIFGWRLPFRQNSLMPTRLLPKVCSNIMLLNVRDGKPVGLPISSAPIIANFCSDMAFTYGSDTAYVNAHGDTFGPREARLAATLSVFFPRVGVVVPDPETFSPPESRDALLARNEEVVRMVGDAVDDIRRVIERYYDKNRAPTRERLLDMIAQDPTYTLSRESDFVEVNKRRLENMMMVVRADPGAVPEDEADLLEELFKRREALGREGTDAGRVVRQRTA
jgi:hypothetical protein